VIVKALSVQQPWAWLIIHGGKDIANRTWATRHRGPLVIHASKKMTEISYDEAAQFAASLGVTVPPMGELQRGGIVGMVDVFGMAYGPLSKWYFGPVGWQLKDPRPLQFREMSGQLGLFEVEVEI